MFEHRSHRLLTRAEFYARMALHAGYGGALLLASLSAGVLGYHVIEGQNWIDALLNASMILGGMGPVAELHTDSGKIFASAYALFSGTIFLVAAGIMFAPVFHRILHRFHWESAPDQK